MLESGWRPARLRAPRPTHHSSPPGPGRWETRDPLEQLTPRATEHRSGGTRPMLVAGAPGPGCLQEALAVARGPCRRAALPLSRFSARREALGCLGFPSVPIYGLAQQLGAEAPSGVPAAMGVAALSAGAGG